MSRLQEKYKNEIVSTLLKEFAYKCVMQVPHLDKITVNVGVGEAVANPKALEAVVMEITKVTGQKPVITKAKKSIAAFKLRTGMPVGCSVTLRGRVMYEFLERLIAVTLPRVRDFRGVPRRSFDGRGNYTLGLTDQLIFTEVDYTKVDKVRGMNVTICTSAATDDDARALLVALGMPFSRDE